jgi:hypothetical protein
MTMSGVTMSLKQRLMEDLRRAIREGDETRKATIRMIRAAIANEELKRRGQFVEAEEAHGTAMEDIQVREQDFELDDSAILAIIQKEARMRQDAIEQYRKGGRDDLVTREEAELKILQEYLPKMMSREEIEVVAREVIAEVGATGPRQMGAVMRPLMERLRGQADGRLVSQVVRELLENMA